MVGSAAKVGHMARRVLRSGICLGVVTCVGFAATAALSFAATSAQADALPEALAKAYQSNPQLNAERAKQRATDENVPQALAGYRPQIIASLSAGLQVQSGREALRNVGQGVLLDAVTAYTNVLANQSLVEAQRSNVAFLRETLGITQKRLNAGDLTPTDTAQAEARLNRGLSDLNAAEVSLAISQATYAQVIGNPPTQLRPAETVDRYLPRSRDEATDMAFRQHPAVMAAGFDVDVASTTIRVAESSLLPTIGVQGNASHSRDADPSLTTLRT